VAAFREKFCGNPVAFGRKRVAILVGGGAGASPGSGKHDQRLPPIAGRKLIGTTENDGGRPPGTLEGRARGAAPARAKRPGILVVDGRRSGAAAERKGKSPKADRQERQKDGRL